MSLLLLTNDDGCRAAGLRALWRELESEYDTIVVAPARQKSWIGKALTNPGPLTVAEEEIGGKRVLVVHDGTPADCANLGIFHLAPRKPDVVISGINVGANFTNSLVLASGTVGAALEAALNGVLGIAVSLALDAETERALHGDFQAAQVAHFEPAARAVKIFLREWLSRSDRAAVKLINIVIPQHFQEPPRFFNAEPLAYEYGSVFDKRGGAYYNRSRGFLESTTRVVPHSDVWTVKQGVIAYTCYTGNLERAGL